MLREGTGAGVVGISKEALEGTEPGWTGAAGLSHQGQLSASVRERADCGGLSRRRVVSRLHAGSAGAHHPGAFDWRQNRSGICLCQKPAAVIAAGKQKGASDRSEEHTSELQ